MVELADLQDQEVGDGTTSVVIIAAELLRVRWHLCAGGALLFHLQLITARKRAGAQQDSSNNHHVWLPYGHEGGYQVPQGTQC